MAIKARVPERNQELIFLDPDDDLATVRAKLESSPADEIFLVIPKRTATLRTPLEFRILARLAHELSTDVTIVSQDGGRRRIAKQEGFRTRRGYRGVRHVAPGATASRRPALAFLDALPLPSLSAIAVVGILGGLLLVVAFGVLPIMRVTVTPASESIQRDLEMTVDSKQRTDQSKGVLQGEEIEASFEVAGSVPTTGQRNLGREAAKGEVVFSNASPNPVVLPARSVIVARNGARFLTDAEVRINPFSYGAARVSATSEQRGNIGNVEANQMAGVDPPVDKLTVSNPRPMTGGAERAARTVAAADLIKLKEQLVGRAREQAMAQFQARGGGDKSVPPNALQIKVNSESYQPLVDGEGDQLNGTMSVAATVIGWDNAALNNLAQAMLLSKYGPGHEVPMSQLRLTPPEVVETRDGRMRLKLGADAMVLRNLDVGIIADQVRGRSPTEARAALAALPGVADSPRVEINPSWAPRAYRVEVGIASPK